MSIVGIFTRSQPSIGGVYVDAVLEESTELQTEITEFPIEDGSVGNDHAVVRPLRLTMTIGVSDNPFRVARAKASEAAGALPGLGVGVGAGLGVGAAIGRLSGRAAAVAGLLAGAANTSGQAASYSTSVLEKIRALQRDCAIIDVVPAKGPIYQGCMITRTYQQTTKQNEGGLELVVELQQLQIIDQQRTPLVNPPVGDTAATQAQPTIDLGRVTAQ